LSVAENGIGHPGGFVAAELLGRSTGSPLQGICLAGNPQLSCPEMIAMLKAVSQQCQDVGEAAVARGARRLESLDFSNCAAELGSRLVPTLLRTLAQCPGLIVDLREGSASPSVAVLDKVALALPPTQAEALRRFASDARVLL
jgi:hypothetical protein